MKSNEFVKKYGVEYAKHILTNDAPLVLDLNYTELKRLVDSYELVEGCSGIDVVKRHLKEGNVFRFEEKPLMRQAILDVESCL